MLVSHLPESPSPAAIDRPPGCHTRRAPPTPSCDAWAHANPAVLCRSPPTDLSAVQNCARVGLDDENRTYAAGPDGQRLPLYELFCSLLFILLLIFWLTPVKTGGSGRRSSP